MTGSLRDQPVGTWLEALASKSPTPGGGAVAALLTALGAATAHMTLNYSIGKKTLAPHDSLHHQSATLLQTLRDRALDLAERDAEAYAALNALWKLPQNDPKRQAEFPAAARTATEVPLSVLRDSTQLLRLLKQLCGATNDMLNSDLAIAAISVEAAGRAAAWNVRINLPSIADTALAGQFAAEMAGLLEDAASLLQHIITHCDVVAAQSSR